MPPKRKKAAAGAAARAAAAAAAAAAGKAATGKDGKTGIMLPKKPTKGKKKKLVMKYQVYIHKVLKQVRPKLGISKKSMMVMNNFVVHHFQNLAKEASILAYCSKKKTITVKELKAAVKLALPLQLQEFADRDGDKAVLNFENEVSSNKKSQGRKRGRGQQG